jgi:hypothetical protein
LLLLLLLLLQNRRLPWCPFLLFPLPLTLLEER